MSTLRDEHFLVRLGTGLIIGVLLSFLLLVLSALCIVVVPYVAVFKPDAITNAGEI